MGIPKELDMWRGGQLGQLLITRAMRAHLRKVSLCKGWRMTGHLRLPLGWQQAEGRCLLWMLCGEWLVGRPMRHQA